MPDFTSEYALILYGLLLTFVGTLCEIGIFRMMLQENVKNRSVENSAHLSSRTWRTMAGFSIGPLLAAGFGLYLMFHFMGLGSKTIAGSTDIPGGMYEAQIPVPLSPPYVVHASSNWGGDIEVLSKEKGYFSVRFGAPSPEGGGVIDWQITPRGESSTVASAIVADSPTITPTPAPKPWQTFIQGAEAGQKFALQIRLNPIPGPHTVDIVATDSSHSFAVAAQGWLQGWPEQKWTIIEHGQSGAFIGEPSEYSLDDGITIRAKVSNVDAETLRLAFLVSGLSVHRIILPDTDNRPYPILEIGNIPYDQRSPLEK